MKRISIFAAGALALAAFSALGCAQGETNDPNAINAITNQKSQNPDVAPPAPETADSPKAMKGKGPAAGP